MNEYQIQFVEDFYTYVLQKLNGTHQSCKRLRLLTKPSKFFIIGTLADSSKDYAVGEPTGQAKIQSRTAMRHNSFSINFKVPSGTTSSIMITPSCSVFLRVYPNFDEQKDYLDAIKTNPELEEKESDPGFAEIWTRYDCKFPKIEFLIEDEGNKEIDFTDNIEDIYQNENLFSKKGFVKDWMESKDVFEAKLSEHIKSSPRKKIFWKAEIHFERERFTADSDIITIRMINVTKKDQSYETFLFNCHLKIELLETQIIPFEYEYEYEDIKYKQQNMLRCLNCQADYKNGLIQTRHWAIFKQLKFAPRTSFNGITAEFEKLKSEDCIATLEALEHEMKKLQDIYKGDSRNSEEEFSCNIKQFETVLSSYQTGIDTLKQNEMALKAFRLMQETFMNASNFKTWRLFQIIFIVSLIPDLVIPNRNRHRVELLHVKTGGGKSEAYFGIAIFQMFLDRLRGKHRGVSGFVKFPLRMLSIQQLHRIAKIIIWAEKIKKNNDIGGEPFSLGYFVGVSDEFPRFSLDAIRQIKKLNEEGKEVKGILLDECPFCKGGVIREINKELKSIYHECKECHEQFNLYYTNEEVYRFLPSFIVSTVDKLASVASNRRFKNLLGGRISKCPDGHGYVPLMDFCEVKLTRYKTCKKQGMEEETPCDGPSLMIQDEMHLLREGFGTIDSHFESLLNTMLNSFSNKEFKYLGLTATVSGVKEQIKQLYGKDVFVFPGKSPMEGSEHDFFFKYEKIEDDIQTQRIILGLKPNLRDNQYASLHTLHHIADYFKYLSENKEEMAKKYCMSVDDFLELLSYYQCLLTYHTKKADVHGMNYFLHTVVTSKIQELQIVSKPLTGDNSLDEIKEAINEIEAVFGKKIHVTFATSVVSHGVDINRWNVMIFQGMTRNTSEYIQSYSRVGREFVGIIFMWFYPNRVRDLSYYQNFELYHEMLDHKVERTPLSRWANLGFKQTFTSIFCGSILNYFSNLMGRPIYRTVDVNEIFENNENREKLIEFIKKAYYTHLDHIGVKRILSQIPNEVERRLNYLANYTGVIDFFPNALANQKDYYFQTQYGMRGIQPEVSFSLSGAYQHIFNKYTKEGES